MATTVTSNGDKAQDAEDVKGLDGQDMKGPNGEGVKVQDGQDVKGPDSQGDKGSDGKGIKESDSQSGKESDGHGDKEEEEEEEEDFSDGGFQTMLQDWIRWNQLLAMTNIFSHLDGVKRETLSRNLESVVFNDKQIIIKKDDVANAFFIIEDGIAIVYEIQNEVHISVGILKRADHIGAVALHSKTRHKRTVIANGTCKCVRMNKNDFEREVEPMVNFWKTIFLQYQSFTSLLV